MPALHPPRTPSVADDEAGDRVPGVGGRGCTCGHVKESPGGVRAGSRAVVGSAGQGTSNVRALKRVSLA